MPRNGEKVGPKRPKHWAPEKLADADKSRNPKVRMPPKRYTQAPPGIPQAEWDELKPREKYRLWHVLNVDPPGPGTGAILAGIYARDSAIVHRARQAARSVHRALRRLQLVTWCDATVKPEFKKLAWVVQRIRACDLKSVEVARRAQIPHGRLMDILYCKRLPNLFESVRLARVWGTTAEHLAWALAASFSKRLLEEGVVHATRKRLRNSTQLAFQTARYLPAPVPFDGKDNLPSLMELAQADGANQILRPSKWVKRGIGGHRPRSTPRTPGAAEAPELPTVTPDPTTA